MLLVIVPLFSGPILVGWAGGSWSAVLVCAAGFALYQSATRRIDLHLPSGLLQFTLTLCIQVTLCGALFGIGVLAAWGLLTLSLPIWIPLALTLGASVLGA